MTRAVLAAALIVARAGAAQVSGIQIGNGICRFFESEEAAKAAPPSFSLEKAPRITDPVRKDFPFTPVYSSLDGKRTVTLKIPDGSSLYGLGAAPGPILRNGFKSSTDALATPWIMGVRPDGSAFGMLMDTAYRCWVDLSSDIVFSTDAPSPAAIVFNAENPGQLLENLDQLTGRMEMPPIWALGLSIRTPDGTEAPAQLALQIREKGIPADSAFLGSGPDGLSMIGTEQRLPGEVMRGLRDKSFHIIAPLATSIANRPGDKLFDSGQTTGAWAGPAAGDRVPDFTKAAGRTWWSGAVNELVQAGPDGVSLDRLTLPPETCILEPDPSLGAPGPASSFVSALSALCERATREGFRETERNRRPVVIAPPAPVSSQRWAAAALPPATDPHNLISAALSLSLSGQPLVVATINPAELPAAQLRSMIGAAMTMPMVSASLRLEKDAIAGLSADDLAVLRRAMTRRSRLTPYLYTRCFSAFFTCEPILRPLGLADSSAQRGDQAMYLIGPDLLVIPRLSPEASKPACPLKGWRKLDLDGTDDADLPDLYLRPGAILPLGPVVQYAGEKPLDPVTLLINLDASGTAVGSLYEDAGEGYEFYQNQARRVGYKAAVQNGALFVRLSSLDFGLPLPKRALEVKLLTDSGVVTGAGSERGTIKIDLPKPPTPNP